MAEDHTQLLAEIRAMAGQLPIWGHECPENVAMPQTTLKRVWTVLNKCADALSPAPMQSKS